MEKNYINFLLAITFLFSSLFLKCSSKEIKKEENKNPLIGAWDLKSIDIGKSNENVDFPQRIEFYDSYKFKGFIKKRELEGNWVTNNNQIRLNSEQYGGGFEAEIIELNSKQLILQFKLGFGKVKIEYLREK